MPLVRNTSLPAQGPASPTGDRALAVDLTPRSTSEAAPDRGALPRRLLATADVIALGSALALSGGLVAAPHVSPALLLTLPCFVLVAKVLGLYDRDDIRLHAATVDEIPTLAQLSGISALLFWLSAPILVDAPVNRIDVLVLWLTMTCLLILGRLAARRLANATLPPERCLVVGDAIAADRFAEKLAASRIRAEVVARLPIEEAHELTALDPTCGRLAGVRTMIRDLDVHRVVVNPSTHDVASVADLVRTLESLKVQVSIVPRTLEVMGSSVALDELDGMTLLSVRRFALSRSSRAVKRTFDFIATSAGLIVVAPVMLTLSALVRLDSRGPVFFRQQRIGRDGRPFWIFKFRTMVDGADAGKHALRELNEGADGFFKIADDPRVTRVGRLLRRTSLDELPQLFNVLRGEMSLVGPRPLIAEEDSRVPGWYRRRLELTPGMTGHWQVLGSSRVPMREMMTIDYLYAVNWSLWNDIKIILRTVGFVLGRRGL
jgi:exopolysaccharide biosynthesis polyprenyl glycosylphosphotransferase